MVPGPLFLPLLALCGAGIHALRNVGALLGKVVGDVHALGVEHLVILSRAVAYLADGVAHQLLVVEVGLRSDFAGKDDMAVLDQHFAGHAALRVLRQACVQHAVGDVVSDLVRVPFAHALRGENVNGRHIIVILYTVWKRHLTDSGGGSDCRRPQYSVRQPRVQALFRRTA